MLLCEAVGGRRGGQHRLTPLLSLFCLTPVGAGSVAPSALSSPKR